MGIVRSALLAGSESRWLREHAKRHRFVRKAVSRFMPGETVEAALDATRTLGVGTVLTQLGENVRDLEQAAKHAKDGIVDGKAFKAAGLIHSADRPVKILGDGELKSKVTVKAERFSEEAKKKIEAAGGKAELLAKPEPKPVVRHKNKTAKKIAKS